MKKIITVLCFAGMGLIFSAGCKAEGTNSAGVNAAKKNEEMKFNAESAGAAGGEDMKMTKKHYTKDTKVADVINDPVFGNFARLLFPLNANYWSGERLKDIRLLWYSHINADNTAEILNALKEQALLRRGGDEHGVRGGQAQEVAILRRGRPAPADPQRPGHPGPPAGHRPGDRQGRRTEHRR